MSKYEPRHSVAPDVIVDYHWVKTCLKEYDRNIFEEPAIKQGAQVTVMLFEQVPVAGCISLVRLGWTHIESLWVGPEHRCNGLGTTLVKGVEDKAKNDDSLGVRISTTSGHEAVRLYRQLGYKIDARWPIRDTKINDLEEILFSKTFG